MNPLLVFILGIIFGAVLLFIALEVRERRQAKQAGDFFTQQGKILSDAMAKRPKLEPLPSDPPAPQPPSQGLRTVHAELAEANRRAGQLQAQLAGCGTAALGSTSTPAKIGDYGWSQSYQDVFELRKKYDQLLNDAAAAGLGKASEN